MQKLNWLAAISVEIMPLWPARALLHGFHPLSLFNVALPSTCAGCVYISDLFFSFRAHLAQAVPASRRPSEDDVARPVYRGNDVAANH